MTLWGEHEQIHVQNPEQLHMNMTVIRMCLRPGIECDTKSTNTEILSQAIVQ